MVHSHYSFKHAYMCISCTCTYTNNTQQQKQIHNPQSTIAQHSPFIMHYALKQNGVLHERLERYMKLLSLSLSNYNSKPKQHKHKQQNNKQCKQQTQTPAQTANSKQQVPPASLAFNSVKAEDDTLLLSLTQQAHPVALTTRRLKLETGTVENSGLSPAAEPTLMPTTFNL